MPDRDEGEQLLTRTRATSPVRSAGIELRRWEVGRDPDVRDGDDEEDGREHPRRIVDLTLEAAPRAVAASQPTVATTSDGASKAGRLGCLQQHPADQKDGDGQLHDHARLADLVHGTDESVPGAGRPAPGT